MTEKFLIELVRCGCGGGFGPDEAGAYETEVYETEVYEAYKAGAYETGPAVI